MRLHVEKTTNQGGSIRVFVSFAGTRDVELSTYWVLKEELLEELKKSKFSIHNIKDPDAYIKNKSDILESKRKLKNEKTKKEEKEVKKKESIEDKLTEEEKKKLEKQEIDRLLTKKF